jgi:5-methylcytosine-specific restriction endonuclease McrA
MVVRIIWRSFIRGLFKALGLDSPYSAKGYGPNWTKQRQKCLERDGWVCQVCEVSDDELDRGLSVHHITPRRKYDDNWDQNQLSNLITLCPECHGRFEGKFTESTPKEFAEKAQQEL